LSQVQAQYDLLREGPRIERIEKARAQFEQAKARLELAKIRLDYATLIELHHPDYLQRDDLTNLYTVEAHASLEPRQVEDMRRLGLEAT
jgi:hypothetical protein